MKALDFLVLWPKSVAEHFLWAAPLAARLIAGYTFMLTGWGKLMHLDKVGMFFMDLGIPFPHVLTPIVSGFEFFGGLGLILGLFTRIFGGALAVIMVVAILSAQLGDVHGVSDLLGLEEATYFAVFTWFAIAGAGKFSLDHLIETRAAKS